MIIPDGHVARLNMPRRYRKKPVVIEAMQLLPVYKRVADWCGGQLIRSEYTNSIVHMVISTLEGDMTANIGDWIIRGVNGEFYPCKPDIFATTYEAAFEVVQ